MKMRRCLLAFCLVVVVVVVAAGRERKVINYVCGSSRGRRLLLLGNGWLGLSSFCFLVL